MTALLDPRQTLARAAGVERVLTAVVVAAEGRVAYRGRIVDPFAKDGKRREGAITRELRDAIAAAIAGRVPPTRETEVFGCPLPAPEEGGEKR